MIPKESAPHMNRAQRRSMFALMRLERRNKRKHFTKSGDRKPVSRRSKMARLGAELLRRDFIRWYGTDAQKASILPPKPEKPTMLQRITNAVKNKANGLFGGGNVSLDTKKPIFNQRGKPQWQNKRKTP